MTAGAGGERRCVVCEIDVYPSQAMQADMTVREVCPKCSAPFPRSEMTAAAQPVQIVRGIGDRALGYVRNAGGDVLSSARTRLTEIDRQLATHDALIDERAQLARMIRAAERPTGRPRKRALRIAR